MSLILPIDSGARPVFQPETSTAFVNQQLPFYDSQYVRVDQLKFALCAFNVAEKIPPANLAAVLSESLFPQGQDEPDVVVIGLQEVDMSASALIREQTAAAWPWLKAFMDLIGCDVVERSSTSKYYLVASKQLAGIVLIACIRRASIDPSRIREVVVNTVAIGVLGAVANKGSIGLRICLERSSYCICTCHLAAHQHAVSRRNQDIADVLSRMNLSPTVVQEKQVNQTTTAVFSPIAAASSQQQQQQQQQIQNQQAGALPQYQQLHHTPAAAAAAAVASPVPVAELGTEVQALASYLFIPQQIARGMAQAMGSGLGPTNYIQQLLQANAVSQLILPKDHDQLVVFGDLNYRVDTSYENAVQLCKRGDIKALLKDDQLCRELKHPHSPWFGFSEAQAPTFLPTYRFDFGTDTYDTSEKRRIPAYTDRILHWSKKKSDNAIVSVTRYTSAPAVRCSDHKPVVAHMSLPLRCTEPKLLEETTSRLISLVANHGLQAVSRPAICLDTSSMDFGERSALDTDPVTRSVVVTNTGQCVAECTVLRRNRDDPSDATWLRLLGQQCTFNVLPGESYKVDVSCVIDWSSLRWMVCEPPFAGRGLVALRSECVIVVRGGGAGGSAGNTLAGGAVVACTCLVRPSCFAMTIEMLLRCGNIPATEAYAMNGPPPSSQIGGQVTATGAALKPQVPKELWLLADAIAKFPTVPGLFSGDFASTHDAFALLRTLSTSCALLPNVVACPTEQCPEGSTSVYAASLAFVLLLRDLQISVIPASLLSAAASATRAGPEAVMKFTTEQLPTTHFNTFVYVVSLLRFLLRPQHAASNELTPELLAEIFSGILFSLSTNCRPQLAARPRWLESSGNSASAASATSSSTSGGGGSSNSSSSLREQADAELKSATKFLIAFLI